MSALRIFCFVTWIAPGTTPQSVIRDIKESLCRVTEQLVDSR